MGSPAPVPEPPSLALLTGALGVLGFSGGVAVRRRARTIRQSPVNVPVSVSFSDCSFRVDTAVVTFLKNENYGVLYDGQTSKAEE